MGDRNWKNKKIDSKVKVNFRARNLFLVKSKKSNIYKYVLNLQTFFLKP